MRAPSTSLNTLLNIHAGEGEITVLMLAYSFLWGIASVTFNTAAYTIFLTMFSASDMSYFYIAAAVVMTLSGLLYNRLSTRMTMRRLTLMASVTLTLSILLIWVGLLAGQPRWLVFFALIWNWVLWTINGLIFWGIAGRLFNLLQGKRLYGLIGAGEVVSGLVIGVLLPLLIPAIGVINSLPIAAFGFAGAALMVSIIGQRYPARLDASDESNKASPKKRRNRSQGARQYVFWIMVLVTIAIVGFYLVDYLFYTQVEVLYRDEAELAGFLATFVALSRFVNLIVRTVLSGRLLSRFGLRAGLVMLPVLLVISVLAGVGVSFAAPQLMGFAVLIIAAKAIDEVLRYTIDYPSYMILFQPISPQQRDSALSLAEGVVSPASGGIAGVLLIVLGTALNLDILTIAMVSTAFLGLWVVIALISHRAYRQALSKAIQHRLLEGTPDLLEDRSNRDVILQLLKSPWHGEVIYAVDLLSQTEDERLPAILGRLVDHPTAEVREDALIRIEHLHLEELVPAVRQVAMRDTSPRVKAAAIRTWASLGETDAVEEISGFVDADEPLVQLGAIVGLLRDGGLEGTLVGGERLISLTRSDMPAERALSARILGAVGMRGFYRPLINLLQDPDPAVRTSALRSVGRIQHPRLWEPTIDNLGSRQLSSAAASSLAAIGQPVIPDLVKRFSSSNGANGLRVHIVRVAGQIGGPDAVDFLLPQMNHYDRRLRTEVVAALARAQGIESAQLPVVRQQIEAEIKDAAQVLAGIADVTGSPHTETLVQALERELELIRLRLFSLLSLLYDPALITRIRESLALPDEERQAYAVELLETLITQDLRGLLLPVMQSGNPADAVKALSGFSPQSLSGREQRIAEIISENGSWFNTWTVACAIFSAARLDLRDQVSTLVKMLGSDEPIIRETALWALSKLAPEQHKAYSQLMAGTTEEVKLTLQSNLSTGTGGTEMLLTIEKVSILRSVSIFEGIPDEMLAQLAGLLEPDEVRAGEKIIQRDEIGSEMYIIVTGRLRVHVGDETLAELGERDIFGEMSLLDPGPRSASVTALADSYLLKLDRDVLMELMQEHIEVSQAVIRVLTNRLRTAVNMLNEAQTQSKSKDTEIWGDLVSNETGLHKKVTRSN